ncbi:MAG: hypothetical protein MUE77_10860 [Sandarakinorhabdus sp.]|nr:hypothetical protein [Sandarakinorhabdus sp.]
MIKSALGLCAAILMAAAPAAAANLVDLSFGGQAQTAPQFSYAAGGVDFTAQAYSWFFNPNPLTSVSQLSAGTLQVQRSAPGIGVAGGMNGDQIDSAMPWGREAARISPSMASCCRFWAGLIRWRFMVSTAAISCCLVIRALLPMA